MSEEKSQGERIADERREHNRNLDVLRAEYAPTSEIDREYQNHQRRLQNILGPTESGIVDGRHRTY
jgi:hypothetical protein